MKRKFLMVLLAIVAALCLCFGLVACGDKGSDPDKDGSAHTHTFENYVYNNDETCTEDGTETGKCSCGKTNTRTKQGTALGHEELDYHAGTATCTSAGTAEYWECPRCEMTFSDDSGETEITELECPPLGHTMKYNAGTATCYAAGTLDYWRCSRCEKDFTDEIGTSEMTVYESDVPLGHEFTVENKCTRFEKCGTEWEYTDGLEYERDWETDSYKVTGIGTESGDIVIPYGYQGKFVTSIGGSAFYGCSGLLSITIPDSVTSIGYGAFYGCSGLLSITIPDSMTTIGDDVFRGCTGLTSITIPDSVTSIGHRAFIGCSGLTEVHITDLAAWCRIDFSDESANPFYYAQHLYLGRTEIKDLIIPNEITEIKDYAFFACSGLESITIGDGVTSIGEWAFRECSGLTSVTIGSGVTEIGSGAFLNCSRLTSVTIESGSIGSDAFGNCNKLTSVTIGNSVTSIGNYAFEGCDGLTEVHISDLAAWCRIDFSDESANPLGYAHYLYLNGNEVSELIIPNEITEIKDYVFCGCRGLTSITIPDSVTSIGGSAFYGCSGLTSVTIPDSVTSIGEWAFYYCSGLTSITIPDSVTEIEHGAFYYCDELMSVTIGSGVTSIGDMAFYYCNRLTEVHISDLAAWCRIDFGGNKANPLHQAHHLYLNEDEIKELIIPNEITEIKDYAFYDCYGLTSVMIGSGVTSIGGWAFNNCEGLTSITIGGNVTSMGYEAFSGCRELTSIEYAGSVEEWNAIKKESSWNRNTNAYIITCADGTIAKDGTVTYFE